MANIFGRIAQELGVREQQVEATVALLDGGATVPFVARYRKEVTGGLDDAQLRTLEERLTYLRELEERRTAVLDSIREQGKLDAALEAAILAADSKARLEDIYLPYKPKRRTKAEIAKEAGLEPLAELLLTQPDTDPKKAAKGFVNAEKEIANVAAALEGARAILVERFAEDADLIGQLREEMWSNGRMISKARRGKRTEGEKFKDYFEFGQALDKLPSHRILAMFRGEKEEILDLQIQPDREELPADAVSGYERKIMQRFAISDQGRAGDKWLAETVRWAWRTKIQVHLNIDLRMRLWTAAETEAVRVFASNLRDLLLAAPAGARVTMGLDPGIDHLMAHDLVARYKASKAYHPGNVVSFTSYCGGVPKIANPFRYKFSWAPVGVLKALRPRSAASCRRDVRPLSGYAGLLYRCPRGKRRCRDPEKCARRATRA